MAEFITQQVQKILRNLFGVEESKPVDVLKKFEALSDPRITNLETRRTRKSLLRDPGGPSFGAYQIAAGMGNLHNFLEKEGKDYKHIFEGLLVAKKDFAKKWKKARKNPKLHKKFLDQVELERPDMVAMWNAANESGQKDFTNAQDNWAWRTHINPFFQGLKRNGVNIESRPLQEAFAAIAIHSGPGGYREFVKGRKRKGLEPLEVDKFNSGSVESNLNTIFERRRKMVGKRNFTKRLRQEETVLKQIQQGIQPAVEQKFETAPAPPAVPELKQQQEQQLVPGQEVSAASVLPKQASFDTTLTNILSNLIPAAHAAQPLAVQPAPQPTLGISPEATRQGQAAGQLMPNVQVSPAVPEEQPIPQPQLSSGGLLSAPDIALQEQTIVPKQAQTQLAIQQELQQAGRDEQLGSAAIHGLSNQLLPVAIAGAGAGLERTSQFLARFPSMRGAAETLDNIGSALKTSARFEDFLDPDYEPVTPNEKALSLLVSFADPALPGAMKAAGAVLKTAKVAPFGKAILKAQRRIGLAKKGQKLGLETAKQALRETNKRLLNLQFKARTIKPAMEVGLVELGVGTAAEMQEKNFSPGRVAERVATGALLGGGLGATGQAFKRLRDVKRARTAFAGANMQPQVRDAIEDLSYETVRTHYRKLRARAKAAGKKYTPPTAAKFNREWNRTQLELMDKAGIPVYPEPVFKSKLAKQVTNPMILADDIQRRTGIRMPDSINKLIIAEGQQANIYDATMARFIGPMRRLEKVGLPKNEILQRLQYVEQDAAGNLLWNPEAIIKPIDGKMTVLREKSFLPEPTPQQMEDLGTLRKVFTDLFESDPTFARRAGFVEGYVPQFTRRAMPGDSGGLSNASSIENPFFLKHKREAFNPNIHETDFATVASRYARAYSSNQAYGPMIPEFQRRVQQLLFMGQRDAAQTMINAFARTAGLRQSRNVAELFAESSLRSNENLLRQIASQTPDPRGFFDELATVFKSSMHSNLVFANLRTQFKQFFQWKWVGMGEIGDKWSAHGKRVWGSKQGKADAMEVMPLMRALRSSFVEENINRGITRPGLKRLQKVLEAPANLTGLKVRFNKGDMRNRGIAYLGSRDQLKAAFERNGNDGMVAAMDGLLNGEKSIVQKAFQRGGIDEAAKAYGILRSRRINYHYGFANRPELFSGPLGEKVPFVTWSGNQFNRLVRQDMAQIFQLKGQARRAAMRRMAKRIVMPLIWLNMFSAATGYEVPGALPAEAFVGLFASRPFPFVTQAAEDFAKTKDPAQAVRALAEFTPWGPAKRIVRDVSQGKGVMEGVMRFKKLPKDNFIQQLREAFLGSGDFTKE